MAGLNAPLSANPRRQRMEVGLVSTASASAPRKSLLRSPEREPETTSSISEKYRCRCRSRFKGCCRRQLAATEDKVGVPPLSFCQPGPRSRQPWPSPPSRPGEFHPEPLTDSGLDTLASSG